MTSDFIAALNLLIKDKNRKIISTMDEDVMKIFLGNLEEAIQGLHEFYMQYKEDSFIIHDIPGVLEIIFLR
jgi:hypothetical protein